MSVKLFRDDLSLFRQFYLSDNLIRTQTGCGCCSVSLLAARYRAAAIIDTNISIDILTNIAILHPY